MKIGGAFNFFYIDSFNARGECELYKGIALLCYSRELVKAAASCPNDYVVVIGQAEPEVRSSSYMNVLSINSEHPENVLLHEFGHAFVNLAEEYVPAKLPRKARNCVSACEKFGDEKDGCFVGCSLEDYFRSIDNGIMRTLLSDRFGIFNELLIEERIGEVSPGITGRAVSEVRNCKDEKYLAVEVIGGEEGLDIISRHIEPGCLGENGYGTADYSLFDRGGNVIKAGSFNPEFIFTDVQEGEEITGEVFESDRSFVLKLPTEGVSSLEIIREGKTTQFSLEDIGARACRI